MVRATRPTTGDRFALIGQPLTQVDASQPPAIGRTELRRATRAPGLETQARDLRSLF
jgi:hypothetical protein